MPCVRVSLKANMSDLLLLFWMIWAIVPLRSVFFVLFCSLCFCKVLFIVLGFVKPDQKISEHHSDSLSTGCADSLEMTVPWWRGFSRLPSTLFLTPGGPDEAGTEESERPSGGGVLGSPVGHAYTLSHTLPGFSNPSRLSRPFWPAGNCGLSLRVAATYWRQPGAVF